MRTKMKTREALIAEHQENYDLGYRYCRHVPVIGAELERSHVWDDYDNRTDEELSGTCCFRSWDLAAEYAKYSIGALVLVRGLRTGGGDMPYEAIIDEAEVVAVWMRSNAAAEWERVA